jgi:flagellar assembly protein FliH
MVKGLFDGQTDGPGVGLRPPPPSDGQTDGPGVGLRPPPPSDGQTDGPGGGLRPPSPSLTFPLEQLEPSAPPPGDTHQQILARAASEGERILDRARAQGYAEGHERGLQDGLAEITAATQALAQAVAGVQELRGQTAEQIERDAVELALALAAKIIAGTLELQPERVLDVVRGALRRVGERHRIAVLVDPADFEIVSGALPELQLQLGAIESCDVQADRRVGRGGAIVRTAEGEIDVTVQTQLERAQELALTALHAQEA